MNSFLTLVLLCLVFIFPAVTFAEKAQEMPPPYEGSDALKAIKSLAGTWEGTHVMDGKEVPGKIEYKVSSNGSTVVETMFPGSPHEMVNVYHDKSGSLTMTHYCSVGNQPHLDLTAMKENRLLFSLSSKDNEDLGHEGHMHDLTITMVDANHIKQEWSYFEKGGNAGGTTFTLARTN